MKILYFDFEYRNNEVKEALVLMSWMTSVNKQPQIIDCRQSEGSNQVSLIVQAHQDHIWIAYNAQADLKCLLALGIDIRHIKVIDTMAEARMITLTHQGYRVESQSLLASLRALGIEAETESDKKDIIRDLILSKTEYSPEEWGKICDYGPTDIIPLPKLMMAVSQIHEQVGSPLTLDEMLARGEYVKAVTELSFRSKGFPIDEDRLMDVYGNSHQLKCSLIESAVAQYGPIYWDDYSWSHEGFQEFVEAQGLTWEQTESGRLRLDKDYFKAQSQRYPELAALYEIRNLIRSISGTDLRPLMVEGHIKPSIFTFSQKTGRNSPKPSYGFVLNLPPWLRTMIKPKSGMALIGADWAQQEIAIAAGLSGDENLLAAYNNPDGDVYLTLAKMAGVVPADGTKKSHPIERKTFKAIQLGLGYGKGVQSLALDVYEANRDANGMLILSMEAAYYQAESIYEWHQQVFKTYWDWLRDSIDQARIDEYLRTVDGWTYFVNDQVRDTQLLNYPLQSAGAAMMRQATLHIANTRQLDMVCSLHDAFYINCQADQKDKHIALLTGCMNQACEDILVSRIHIPVEISVWNSQSGYRDSRADQIDELLKRVIQVQAGEGSEDANQEVAVE